MKERLGENSVKSREDAMCHRRHTPSPLYFQLIMAKQRQYLTPAIVPDSPTSADGDTTIIAALDSIFNDLDSTNSSDFLTQTGTNTKIEITELESAAATPSPPKAPTQAKCMQKPTKPKKKQKSAKNGAYMHPLTRTSELYSPFFVSSACFDGLPTANQAHIQLFDILRI